MGPVNWVRGNGVAGCQSDMMLYNQGIGFWVQVKSAVLQHQPGSDASKLSRQIEWDGNGIVRKCQRAG